MLFTHVMATRHDHLSGSPLWRDAKRAASVGGPTGELLGRRVVRPNCSVKACPAGGPLAALMARGGVSETCLRGGWYVVGG